MGSLPILSHLPALEPPTGVGDAAALEVCLSNYPPVTHQSFVVCKKEAAVLKTGGVAGLFLEKIEGTLKTEG